MMNGTVESRLEKWYSDTTLEYNVIGKWISKGPLDVSKATSAQQSYLKNTVQRLQQLLFLSSSRTCLSSGAIFKRGYGSNSYYPHERVEAGDMVQVLIAKHDPSAQFITVSAEGVGSPLFFVVGGLISVTSGSIWLVVKRCTTGPSHAPQVPDYNGTLKIHVTVPPFYEPNSVFQFLELSKHVRKIGCIHDCKFSGQCSFNEDRKSIIHSTTTLGGGRFFLLSRFTAYPPRRS